ISSKIWMKYRRRWKKASEGKNWSRSKNKIRNSRQGICKIYGEYNMEREGLWRMMKGKRILAYFCGGQE
ncbi:hypothetical protein, partial [Selenomonas noxia]|uniref:hypothetical protein n=1 Tax=Selenomonas noxia TaxID=135083 RepID=UPI0028E6080B